MSAVTAIDECRSWPARPSDRRRQCGRVHGEQLLASVVATSSGPIAHHELSLPPSRWQTRAGHKERARPAALGPCGNLSASPPDCAIAGGSHHGPPVRPRWQGRRPGEEQRGSHRRRPLVPPRVVSASKSPVAFAPGFSSACSCRPSSMRATAYSRTSGSGRGIPLTGRDPGDTTVIDRLLHPSVVLTLDSDS
jgi:hypothetical protein